MAARYWVGGSGTWDATTTHWSTSSGGASGASVPTLSDNVIFDANSGLAGTTSVNIAVGATCGGLSISGVNAALTIQLIGNLTFGPGTYSVVGNTQGQRVMFQSNVDGTPRTLTCGGTWGAFTDVDFRDIVIAGSAGTLSGTRIGDARGNSGITFSPSATQTWQGTNGGNWSDLTKWTSRVPLPQDDVVVASAFAASQTINTDVRRLGRSLDFSGCTGSPAIFWAANANPTWYGSLDARGTTFNTAQSCSCSGRGGSYTLCFDAGQALRLTIGVGAGTYTLLSDYVCGPGGNQAFAVNGGTFNANGFNVTCLTFGVAGQAGITINMGSGTWTLTSATGTVWNSGSPKPTINAQTSTIVISDASATAKTFNGNGLSFNVLRFTAGGSGALTFGNSASFRTLDLQCTTARTITLPAAGKLIVYDALTLQGAAGQLLSVVSSSPGISTAIDLAGTLTSAFNAISADVLINSVAVPNMVPNPDVETSTLGWSGVGGGETIVRSTEQAKTGSYSLKVTCLGDANGCKIDLVGARAGQTYRYSVWVWVPVGMSAKLRPWDDVALFGPATIVSGTSSWQRIAFTGTTAPTSTLWRIAIVEHSLPAGTIYVDAVSVTVPVSEVKTILGLPEASIKSMDELASAQAKTIVGVPA
jgi:hypothetical protein